MHSKAPAGLLFAECGPTAESRLPGCRFRPQDDVVEVYVVENKASGELTDLLSFYSLPSTILGHKDHDLLRAAYMFYTVPGSVPISHLMQVRAAMCLCMCVVASCGGTFRPEQTAGVTNLPSCGHSELGCDDFAALLQPYGVVTGVPLLVPGRLAVLPASALQFARNGGLRCVDVPAPKCPAEFWNSH
jgi:Myristoyl-CoA:protein N-myristoyltransferase, C-terminal domain